MWFAGSLWAPLIYVHRGPLIAVLVFARFRRPASKWFVLIAAATIDGAFPSLARVGLLTLCLAVAVGCIAIAATRPTLLARVGQIAAWLYASMLVVVGSMRTFGWIAGAAPGTVYGLVVAAIAGALAWALAQNSVERLVIDLAALPETDSLVDSLRRALADPTLELSIGTDIADDRPGRTTSVLTRQGEIVGALYHQTLLHIDAETIAGVTTIAGLACDAAIKRSLAVESLDAIDRSSRLLAEARSRESEALARRVRQGPLVHIDRAIALVGDPQLSGQLAAARREVLEVANGLASATITSAHLASALADRTASSPVPVALVVDVAGLTDRAAQALLLICSEVTTNTAKHASASMMSLTLRLSPTHLDVDIVDDGCGGADPRGSGLRGVAERVAALGGHLAIDSPPGRGTRVRITAPRSAVVA